ncbi:unnamed protein product [Eruca vesicaria subsp. sativa]|uniref:Uncharacterized protein n=1 Tax=Eruca vesicaria subsp. sativa TaxID=29727 RepID=A0ABC8KJL4_ERUVS|nr:unnamed protein product [Eruca vesicaria subsp. sativa]
MATFNCGEVVAGIVKVIVPLVHSQYDLDINGEKDNTAFPTVTTPSYTILIKFADEVHAYIPLFHFLFL